ncbi:MAG: hypothetical protein AAFO84_07310 [Cyanobacteria bacterium J06598_1]
MKRIIYSSLSILAAVGTAFVAAEAEVLGGESSTTKTSNETVLSAISASGGPAARNSTPSSILGEQPSALSPSTGSPFSTAQVLPTAPTPKPSAGAPAVVPDNADQTLPDPGVAAPETDASGPTLSVPSFAEPGTRGPILQLDMDETGGEEVVPANGAKPTVEESTIEGTISEDAVIEDEEDESAVSQETVPLETSEETIPEETIPEDMPFEEDSDEEGTTEGDSMGDSDFSGEDEPLMDEPLMDSEPSEGFTPEPSEEFTPGPSEGFTPDTPGEFPADDAPSGITPVVPPASVPVDPSAEPVEPLAPTEAPLAPMDEGEFDGDNQFDGGSEFNDTGAVGSPSDRLIGEGFSPFQLSYLAIGGGLKEAGIPGGAQLMSAYESGDLSAEDIVNAGAMTKRLGTDASDAEDYAKGVDKFLKLFSRDGLNS